ncbi:hypothetical protein ACLE20_05240 [Rhizobium sp. YIM 134829]|uniref:hypothetical protein n=1 Tax=Rhizobium sp. YIM 134829 TaxID=3390453 RepID=UPI00397A68FC
MHTADFDSSLVADLPKVSLSPEQQLRPVVITVICAKLAVFALLMTTLNMPLRPALETAPIEAYAIGDMQLAAMR